MKKIIHLLLFVNLLNTSFSQEIINAPSINKYSNVIEIDYCKNKLIIPTGMGIQFPIGGKIIIIQMKGADLVENNDNTNGQIENYNSAGNYEINEVKAFNSASNDELLLNYAIERSYNTSTGVVQIVSLPEYSNGASIQNVLTCQAWNGSFGGILALKVKGTLNLNANINVSEKGFRGGAKTSVSNGSCFGITGYNDYNCSYSLDCGALKGEGIGNRYETKELARSSNANGGGGGNDHNAGGGGGGSVSLGGNGGNRTNGFCSGLGAFGGINLNYQSNNKLFLSGGGGAGDGGNADGSIGSTAGGNAGGMVIIIADTLQVNGGKIISNGESITTTAQYDGAGGGGAGGLVVLDVSQLNFNPFLTVETKGGKGGDVFDQSGSCPGPGGGGAGGVLWLKSNQIPTNLNHVNTGGVAGVLTEAPCTNSHNGATAGIDGALLFSFSNYYSDTIFKPLELQAGNDTTICGNEHALLWATADASSPFDFHWSWNGGIDSNYNFQFNPEFSGDYTLTATAKYTKNLQECKETYLVRVKARKPQINIVADAFNGDTINIGEVFFISTVVKPPSNLYTYQWNPKDKTNPHNERNTIASPLENETFCITVTDDINCTHSECIDLYVHQPKFIMPNAFSPNSDNINDTLKPLLSNDLKITTFRIYNRWGNLIHNKPTAWNGKINNKDAPLDEYVWYIEVQQKISNKTFKREGIVTLIR